MPRKDVTLSNLLKRRIKLHFENLILLGIISSIYVLYEAAGASYQNKAVQVNNKLSGINNNE